MSCDYKVDALPLSETAVCAEDACSPFVCMSRCLSFSPVSCLKTNKYTECNKRNRNIAGARWASRVVSARSLSGRRYLINSIRQKPWWPSLSSLLCVCVYVWVSECAPPRVTSERTSLGDPSGPPRQQSQIFWLALFLFGTWCHEKQLQACCQGTWCTRILLHSINISISETSCKIFA